MVTYRCDFCGGDQSRLFQRLVDTYIDLEICGKKFAILERLKIGLETERLS